MFKSDEEYAVARLRSRMVHGREIVRQPLCLPEGRMIEQGVDSPFVTDGDRIKRVKNHLRDRGDLVVMARKGRFTVSSL